MDPGGWFQVSVVHACTAVEKAMVQSLTNAQRETLHTAVRKPIEHPLTPIRVSASISSPRYRRILRVSTGFMPLIQAKEAVRFGT